MFLLDVPVLDIEPGRPKQRRLGVKAGRCVAIAKSGARCTGTPVPGDSRCAWHSPAWAEKRREWSRKGGESRSHAARARKTMKSAADVTPVLWTALNDLAAGTLEPARGQAMASVARALTQVHEATVLEERIAALEQAAEIGGKRA